MADTESKIGATIRLIKQKENLTIVSYKDKAEIQKSVYEAP